jgi:spermidine synthase
VVLLADEASSHDRAVCAVAVVSAPRAPSAVRAMKPLERLGEARTPNGTLIALYRHDGAYLIRANGVELMSTRRHLSEDRLAAVACAPIRDRAQVRVLIGGLGLGFTLRAALQQLSDDADVVVAELVPEVVAWNADPRYGLSVEAMGDPRVRVLHDDVINVLRANPGAFDAIMLDTDNGPEGMLMSENARLYATRGIGVTVAALRDGGSIAYWSVGDDPKFARALRGAGLDVDTLRVRAHDTTGPMHTLYVATRRSVTRQSPV